MATSTDKKSDGTTTFSVKKNKKNYSVTLRQPNFKELSFAFSVITTVSGKVNMAEAGRALFDTCKVKCDKEIEKDPLLLFSVCISIGAAFITPAEVKIKKN